MNKIKHALGQRRNNPQGGGDDILYPSNPTTYHKELTANWKRAVPEKYVKMLEERMKGCVEHTKENTKIWEQYDGTPLWYCGKCDVYFPGGYFGS